ncbi:peptide chain release factor H [Asanoa sp. WMMD1127]|uniref:peptide chain release factor H n=1 Tax=Asanoa sp. WMMD1127 TaxID=3016107 RepID=UPI0024179EB1|nr:peptide chain release factor H [Asanoa sp. WMMD1127]MDG4821373.1 peptide chain release factor H [Asanoa sp. WMMD1127]
MTHLLISAGRGPQECAWAVAQLTVRLEREAARRRLTTERVQVVPADRPGTYRSIIIRISGAEVDRFIAGWTGTLCWQAPSPYRPGTNRKNWYVVARPCDLDRARTAFDEADVEIVACRTGGPGGQHRNKASTAVRATHRPSGAVVVVDTERQFSQNRRLALCQLRDRLARADDSVNRSSDTALWHIHDELVRGDPVRVERP